jgi:hypothetical protein
LRALKLSFFGEKGAQGEVAKTTTVKTLSREEFNPITIPEKIGACMLMFTQSPSAFIRNYCWTALCRLSKR